MKCTNKVMFLTIVLTGVFGLSGCGSKNYAMEYSPDSAVSSYRMLHTQVEVPVAEPFATELCVVSGDITDDENVDLSTASGAALFDLSKHNTLYAKNVYEKLYPASLTKVMTALVAIKHGSLDTVITVSSNVSISESGAQVCGLKAGDQLTLDQALHLMLVNSANDAAIVVAEGTAGSLEEFAELMNQEAKNIGATNSHFVNPHGLQDDNHYTTVYDMYLILNEAAKYDVFNQTIQMSSYTTTYTASNGNAKELSVKTTNLYLQGERQAPEKVTILGGKTGTTNAAGHCLALFSKDTAGKPYISIIMRSDSRDGVYEQMTDLLGEINK